MFRKSRQYLRCHRMVYNHLEKHRSRHLSAVSSEMTDGVECQADEHGGRCSDGDFVRHCTHQQELSVGYR